MMPVKATPRGAVPPGADLYGLASHESCADARPQVGLLHADRRCHARRMMSGREMRWRFPGVPGANRGPSTRELVPPHPRDREHRTLGRRMSGQIAGDGDQDVAACCSTPRIGARRPPASDRRESPHRKLGAPLMLQAHQLASKIASCDLSTLSAPDGHTQTDGPGAAQGNKVHR
jgi:hypothetical protein